MVVTIRKYTEFIETMEKAKIETTKDFEKWAGYRPTGKQKILILARSKREVWNHHYVKVIRDKLGRFVSWKVWTWKK